MPFQYRVYAKYQLGYLQLTGIVTGDEVLKAMQEVTSHPYWRPGFNVLWDGRAIRQLLLDLDQMKQIIGFSRDNSERLGPGRSAIVVTRDLDFSISKLISSQVQRDDREFQVFRKFDEALEWLDLPSPIPFLA